MSAMNPVIVDLSKYIETRLFEERPHIRDRRIPVAVIAYQKRLNDWSVADTAYNFSLSEAEILAALLYYEEHKAEIDQQEAEEQEKFEAMKRQHTNG